MKTELLLVALFGTGTFILGFAVASIYTWWQIATRRRGIRLADGTVFYVPLAPAAPPERQP